jgi:hypothetical protein
MHARALGSLLAITTLALATAGLGCGSGKDAETGVLGGGKDAGNLLDSTFELDSDPGGSLDVGTGGAQPDVSPEAFWANDPPPATCGADAGVTPKVPGGTVDCPDDKNREGCPCPAEGQTAACWPGLRKNRERGICQDGTTTCKKNGEVGLAWGPCEGYVLPVTGATSGADACKCFSGGRWDLANLSPCFYSDASAKTIGAVSTLPNYDGTGAAHPACPSTFDKPGTAWTHTTLKTDCAGHFKLCYTLKAGDVNNPLATDCVLTTQCAEGDYVTPNVVQAWGDLAAWKTTDAACADKFNKSGGYGEMAVAGTSVECDGVDKVFLRVGYCSATCNANPSAPGCAGCSVGGGGNF